ncbi:MAG TPA: peptidoglycan-associated lipoprotein Pal [Casimicrobiaceae bacterium]|nr:peptidoglycan-associated lipoprotein Pal [Casimicrobiaceae bacterium]
MRNLLFVVIVAAALTACSTTPTTEAPVEDHGTSGATAPGTGAQTGGAQGSGVNGSNLGGGAGADELRNPNSILSKRSVYFDFDSFVVKDDYKPLVEAHARYLQSHPNARMTVQGNTDERGSREYNIALGQKRADAVKRMMTLLGARDGQIETTSFGEERPKNPGHDESAWAENRRDDIVYAGE